MELQFPESFFELHRAQEDLELNGNGGDDEEEVAGDAEAAVGDAEAVEGVGVAVVQEGRQDGAVASSQLQFFFSVTKTGIGAN